MSGVYRGCVVIVRQAYAGERSSGPLTEPIHSPDTDETYDFQPARIVGIIVAILSLTQFWLGTAFGIYALVILFRKETEALFTKQPDRPAGA